MIRRRARPPLLAPARPLLARSRPLPARPLLTRSRPLLALTLTALALALALGAAGTAAAAATPQTTLPAIEQQVMCVVCRTPLALADGPQADAERRQIRALIAQGKSEQQIKDALVAQYGERVLALPQDDGFNLAVYLVPVAVVALGLGALALALPRWRRSARARAAQPAAPGPVLSDEDMRRLDEDLARHDG